jgi:hypothetical protein
VKFKIPILAVVEARDENDAQRQATIINQQLANPLLKMALKSQGVQVLSYAVGKPQKDA